MAKINGWGRGTFGQLTFGEPIPVVITGVAATSALGNESVTAAANIPVTTVVGTSALGNESVEAAANVTVTAVTATTTLGNESVTAAANAPVTLAAMTSALGDGTAVQAAAVTGVAAVASTSALGDESVTCDANVAVTNVVGTLAAGTVIPVSNNNLNVTLDAAVTTLASVTTKANADITTEGFELTSALNSVNIWERVGTGITTTYTDVPGVTTVYTVVSTTQTPNWQEVA